MGLWERVEGSFPSDVDWYSFNMSSELSHSTEEDELASAECESGQKHSKEAAKKSWGVHQGGAVQVSQEITTLMIKNVPQRFTRKDLVYELNRRGFEGLYNFCHLPCSFETKMNKGYAFVNFATETAARAFTDQLRTMGGRKAMTAIPAAVQGYQSNAQFACSRRMRRVKDRSFRPLLCSAAPAVRLEPPETVEVPMPVFESHVDRSQHVDRAQDCYVFSL